MEEKKIYSGYGVGGGKNINYFKVNYKDNIIVFDDVPNYNIYLEYLSNGLNTDSDISIPRRYLDALMAGVMYQFAVEDMNTPFNRTEQLRRNYVDKMEIVKSMKGSFTKDEFLDTIYKNAKQTPKR